MIFAFDIFLQAIIIGVLFAGVYALAGSGLVLVFGVMRVVDLSRGAFLMIGAYLAWVFFARLGIDPLLALAITAPLLYLTGLGIYKYILGGGALRGREGITFGVIITFGMALFIQFAISYIFTAYFKTINTSYAVQTISLSALGYPTVLVPVSKLIASAMSSAALMLLFIFLYRTRTGTALRATVQNRDAAQLVGVDVEKISTLSFGLNAVTAAAAGTVIALISGFYPYSGQLWIVKLLAIVMLGGMQSMGGLMVGSLILGLAESFTGVYFSVSWTPLIFSGTIIVVLLFRPRGLFGETLTLAERFH